MHHDQLGGFVGHRIFGDPPGLQNDRVIGAAGENLGIDHMVLHIQKNQQESLIGEGGKPHPGIIFQGLAAIDHIHADQFVFQITGAESADQRDQHSRIGTKAFDPAQILQTGIHDAGKIMEPFQQTPGHRLDIAPLDGIGEQQFQHVVIRQAVLARMDIPVPQPLPVTAFYLIHRPCPFFKFKNTKKI